jgi:catechol 2,3-dioxygenase-like lactoylglutathione lyase family enzyme
MKIQGLAHTGICVKNLEKSIQFYNGVLGFKVIEPPCEMVIDQEESKGLGVPGCLHRICLLEVKEGQCIELMEFDNAHSKSDYVLQMNQVGNHHISLLVDDMDGWITKLSGLNLTFLHEKLPVYNEDGTTSWWVLFKDPEGIIIELFQH